MFDFTTIQKQIIYDLTPICINNYLIINEINILPKELVKSIIYDLFLISNEIVLLKDDIIRLEKNSIFELISTCFNPYNNIDILSPEYNKYINMDINDVQRRFLMPDFNNYILTITTCTETIYLLHNNIFDILFNRYCNKNNTYKDIYIKDHQNNIDYYINIMKLPKKYSSLLSIKTQF